MSVDLIGVLALILAVIVAGFWTQFLMLRRIRRLTQALGVLVLQESRKIQRLQG